MVRSQMVTVCEKYKQVVWHMFYRLFSPYNSKVTVIFTIWSHLIEKWEIEFKVRLKDIKFGISIKNKVMFLMQNDHRNPMVSLILSVGGIERSKISFEYMMSPFGVMIYT